MGSDFDDPSRRGQGRQPSDRFPGYDGMEIAALRRYITRRSDTAERRRVEAWAAESVARRQYLTAMRQLYERGSVEVADDTAAAWQRIAARMEPPEAPSVEAPQYVAPWEEPAVRVDVRRQPVRILGGAFAPRRRRMPVIAAAAAAVFVLGGGALILRDRAPVPASAPDASMRQIATARGQRAEVQLGDGSQVVLGVASRLRFASDFGARSRDLYLEGTAYFDVAHDTTRPFRVHTACAITENISTRFAVTAYPETRATQVVVAEGAVALKTPLAAGTTRAVLTRGQLGRLALGDTTATVRAVDPAQHTAWMQDQLVFHDTPLADVVAELRRWYDVDLRIGDSSLQDVPITASFTAESFYEAITVVT
ncbi:MAG: FecR family protein, partial [Gemmatimonadaceae bacterium]